jgi:hypothetical protein
VAANGMGDALLLQQEQSTHHSFKLEVDVQVSEIVKGGYT